MRIIPRYLLREFVRPFLLLLVSLDMLFLIIDLFDNVSKFIETGFPALRILQYYGCLIASYSHWFAPASLMLATLYSMWQLSRNSEITAMRASGISFTSLSMPFLGVALAVAVLEGLNSEYIVPEASSWAARMKKEAFRTERIGSDPRENLQFVSTKNHRQWHFQSIDTASFRSASVVTGEVGVLQEDGRGANLWRIVARDGAEYIDGEWWFRRPKVTLFEYKEDEALAGEQAVGVELAPQDGERWMPQTLRMPGLAETPQDVVLYTRDWENYSVRDMRRTMETSGVESAQRHYDVCYRFAAPWACVIITLFAVPAGLATARQSILKGIFTALGAFFFFYAMTHFCGFMGQRGLLAPIVAAWLPNIVFLVIGTVNFRKLT